MTKLLFSFFILILSLELTAQGPKTRLTSKQKIEQQCKDIGKNKVTGSESVCIAGDAIPKVMTQELSSLESISLPAQEFLYLAQKAHLKKKEDEEKKIYLNVLSDAFKEITKDDLKKAATDLNFSKNLFKEKTLRNEYTNAYKELRDTVNALHQKSLKIESCKFDQAQNFCFKENLNQLNGEFTLLQANKISLLANNPLLSSKKIVFEIERSAKVSYPLFVAKYKKDNNINSLNNYNKTQVIPDVESDDFKLFQDEEEKTALEDFPKLMTESIKDTDEVLDERIKDWEKMITGSKQTILNKEKGVKFYESSMSSEVDNFTYDHQNLILEILESTDVEDELSNPFLGKAVCHINAKNKLDRKKKENVELLTSIGLGVAPFFLGPIGMVTRLAALGRFANFGVKTGAIAGEAALVSYDLALAAESSKRCQALQMSLVTDSNNQKKSEDEISSIYSEAKECKENAETEYLMAYLGGSVGLSSYVIGAASKGATKIGKILDNQIDKASLALNRKRLSSTMDELEIPPDSRNDFVESFNNYLITSGKPRKEALADFKEEYTKASNSWMCKL